MAIITWPITEQEFQQTLIEFATLKGWLVYHTYDSRKSSFGFPDMVLTNGIKTVFAELKSSLGDLSAEQYEWLYNLQMSGEEAFLWTPEDWDEILEVLK